MQIADKYSPQEIEQKWYDYWIDNRLFHSEPDGREPYTIVIPPPNVTGMLHMGHMLNNTLQDVLVRRARMQGENACWVPGPDHASIATEAKVVAKLKAEGIEKSSLSREEFLRHAWDWKEKYGGVILQQLRKLGASCDWERTCFTMDEPRTESVIKVFCDLYEKGKIYRGVRMVNWDPAAQTALSDEEVVFKESHGKLYYLRYMVEGSDKAVIVATTRPETILGDTALCVNPNDPRYGWLPAGARVIVPLVNRAIPVIRDEYVDIEFGTGALKVTPAHDVNDYMLGEKYNLEVIDIFNDDGTINDKVGMYVGQDRFDVRRQIEKDLDAAGLLEKTEDYTNNVGYSERTGVAIEPKLSMQWFLSMGQLAEPATKAVMEDAIRFVPEKYKNTYRHWMENIKDWCISRQLWWGQRIPAWYLPQGGFVVAPTAGEALEKARAKTGDASLQPSDLRQDDDVLDTWFSSWLWPISVFDGIRRPNNKDIEYYYPTNDLVTGPDIIFFWVARMVMMTKHFTGRVPFHDVYMHGLVRDAEGHKMSKSEGNTIDPLDLIQGIDIEGLIKKNTMGLRRPEKAPKIAAKLRKQFPEGLQAYGADALRFTMAAYATLGQNVNFDTKRCEGYRNFCNKLWNATRFVLMNLPEDFQPGLPSEDKLDMSDKWVLTKLNQVAGAMSDNLDHYEMGLAAAKINSFIWDVYCDWFIEIAKPRLNSGDAEQADTARRVLVYVLDQALKLLHPFMPFITEELYQALPGSAETIMTQSWPTFDEAHNWADEEEAFEKVMDYIKAVRTMRTEMNVHPAKKTSMIIETADPAPFQSAEVYLAKFAFATDVTFTEKYEGSTDGMVQVSTHAARGFIPMMELIDRDKELARLNKEKAKAEKELAMFENQLNNPKFVERAPAALVEDIRNKHAKSQDKLANIEQSIKALG